MGRSKWRAPKSRRAKADERVDVLTQIRGVGHYTAMLVIAEVGDQYGLEGFVLRCPWHGWEYDVRNGKSVGPVDKRGLKMFDITVENGKVYLEASSFTAG